MPGTYIVPMYVPNKLRAALLERAKRGNLLMTNSRFNALVPKHAGISYDYYLALLPFSRNRNKREEVFLEVDIYIFGGNS